MEYFDNQLVTKPTSKVLQAHAETAKTMWQSIDGCYLSDVKLQKEIAKAESALYELVGAKKEDFFQFTASERESTTLIYDLLYFQNMAASGKNHIVSPKIDNAHLFQSAERMKEVGVELKLCEVNEFGQMTKEHLEKVISPRTEMISLTWAHPLTGVIQPIWEIADFCEEHQILLYVQAGDIFGKVFFRFQDLPIDILSFDGSRFHALRSGAGFFIKQSGKFASTWQREYRKMPMHRDIASFIAMGAASKEVLDRMDLGAMETARLRNQLEDSLEESVEGYVIFGKKTSRLPNVSCFAILGVPGELLAYRLAKEDIAVSFGGIREQRLENVLNQCKVDPLMAKCAVTVSLSHLTTESEIQRAIQAIQKISKELQKDGQQLWEEVHG